MKKCKFVSQYELDPIRMADESEILLRINIYEEGAGVNKKFTAYVERLDLYEIRPFGHTDFAHVQIWVCDDFFSGLLGDVVKQSEDGILDDFFHKLKKHFTGAFPNEA